MKLYYAGTDKMDGSQWSVLTKCGPLEKKCQFTPVFLPGNFQGQ